LPIVVMAVSCSDNLVAEGRRNVETARIELRSGAVPGTPSGIELKKNAEGSWRFYVDGEEFPIRGVGGAFEPGMLEELKACGGNCIRTWGIDTLEKKVTDGERLIDRAYRVGVMVVPGFWVQHERHGFDYSDEARVRRQRDELRSAIRKYKDHPAVLMWGLGNEMEGPTSAVGSIAVFKELGVLAGIAKDEDPKHPVMTVIAGANAGKIKAVMQHCPSIDVLGINSYGGAAGAGETAKRTGWKKPFAVTEFGVKGHWEVQKTPWGAPYEPTSHEKARTYYATHKLVFEMNEGKEMCLGTFAFVWGWKQECTATWFGMYLPTMEKLSQVDAMTRVWTGKWPANRCPKIEELSSLAHGKVVKPGRTISATVDVKDPEGDEMTYAWSLLSESTERSVGGDAESAPPSYPQLIKQNNARECILSSPSATGNYRLFVTVRDGKGSAATANFPFRVEE